MKSATDLLHEYEQAKETIYNYFSRILLKENLDCYTAIKELKEWLRYPRIISTYVYGYAEVLESFGVEVFVYETGVGSGSKRPYYNMRFEEE